MRRATSLPPLAGVVLDVRPVVEPSEEDATQEDLRALEREDEVHPLPREPPPDADAAAQVRDPPLPVDDPLAERGPGEGLQAPAVEVPPVPGGEAGAGREAAEGLLSPLVVPPEDEVASPAADLLQVRRVEGPPELLLGAPEGPLLLPVRLRVVGRRVEEVDADVRAERLQEAVLALRAVVRLEEEGHDPPRADRPDQGADDPAGVVDRRHLLPHDAAGAVVLKVRRPHRRPVGEARPQVEVPVPQDVRTLLLVEPPRRRLHRWMGRGRRPPPPEGAVDRAARHVDAEGVHQLESHALRAVGGPPLLHQGHEVVQALRRPQRRRVARPLRRVEPREGRLVGVFFPAGRLLDEFAPSTGWKRLHVYADGARIATIGTDGTSFHFGDILGSTRLVLEWQSGTYVKTYEAAWKPFGLEQSLEGDASFKYLGQEAPNDAGLYWFGARYFDPNVGRFYAPDPILGSISAPQTLNRYAYAINDPIALSDPSGMDLNCAQYPDEESVEPTPHGFGTRQRCERLEYYGQMHRDADLGMVILGLIPGLETIADLHFAITDCGAAWGDPSLGNAGACGFSLAFLAMPFVGSGVARAGIRILDRANDVADFERLAPKFISHFEGRAVRMLPGDVAHIVGNQRHISRAIDRLGLHNVDELLGVTNEVLRTGKRVDPSTLFSKSLLTSGLAVESSLHRGFWVVLKPSGAFYRLRTFYVW